MSGATRFGLGRLSEHPKIAALIGEFTVRWSLAEATLMLPLLTALNSQNQEVAAAMLSATNSTEGKVKLVKAAIDNMPPSRADAAVLKKALKALEGLCEKRNEICHHTWAVDLELDRIVTIDFRKTATDAKRVTHRSEESLRDLCNRTMDAARAICLASGSEWVSDEVVKQARL